MRRSVALAATLALGALPGAAGSAPTLHVVATHLDNPRKLAVGVDGSVYVAEGGHGGRTLCLGAAPNRICVGSTGAVVRVAANGVKTNVVTGLLSFAAPDGQRAEGPAEARPAKDGYDVLLQDAYVNAQGANPLGPAGASAGSLVSTPAGKARPATLANLAVFEARHNPDHGVGSGAKAGNPSIDSDPYAFTPYRGGYAIVDAAGNDLLWLKPNGQIAVLAVFPARRLVLSPALRAKLGEPTLLVQAVPSSVAVGPDGALYVGELTGIPYAPGFARVWRIAPNGAPTVYASGFSAISDLTFSGSKLLVLELATGGILHPAAPGALVELAPGGRRTVLARAGLVEPTGVAVANGRIYVANYGSTPAASGHGGELVSLPLP